MLMTKPTPTANAVAAFVALAAIVSSGLTFPTSADAQTRKRAEQPMIVEAANMDAPGLSGARHPSWSAPYTGPSTPMKLSDAIQAVFPASHPTAKLEFDDTLAFTQLSLPTGEARSTALDMALRNAGLGAHIAGDSFLIFKVKNSPQSLSANAGSASGTSTGNPPGSSFSGSTVRQPGQLPSQVISASNTGNSPSAAQAPNALTPQAFQGQQLQQVAIAPPPVRNTNAFTPPPQRSVTPAAVPVSQRAAPSASNLNEQPGAIEGDLIDPSWLAAAPRGTTPVPTAQAIGMLFPPEHPATQLVIESDISQRVSTWRDGLTRRMAMSRVLADAGLIASMSNGVFRVKASPLAAAINRQSAQNSGGAVQSSLSAPPVLAAAPVQPGRPWNVQITDVNLANTFARWGQEAGYKVKWDAPKHLLIGANQTFNGTFEDAIEQALATPGIRNSLYPLEACMYANNPPLARITRLGEQGKDCR